MPAVTTTQVLAASSRGEFMQDSRGHPERGETLRRWLALAERELQQGSIAYNPPQQMRLDERTRIEAA
jgi:hypothetical protein